MKIAFIRNYMNTDLLPFTQFKHNDQDDIILINGKNGIYGQLLLEDIFNNRKLQNIYDYIILVDEDCKIFNTNIVYNIIDYMEKTDYDIIGPADGKAMPWIRGHRYDVPNIFFTIIKTIKIKNLYQITSSQNWKIPYKNDLPITPYNSNTFEAYYKMLTYLIYGLSMNFKSLEAKQHSDQLSSILLWNNEEFCVHTWFARKFNIDRNQTNRIKNTLKQYDL